LPTCRSFNPRRRRNPRRIWLSNDQHDLLVHDKKFYLAAAMGTTLAEGKRAMSTEPQRKRKRKFNKLGGTAEKEGKKESKRKSLSLETSAQINKPR
jgi:hypothetical protein